MAIPIGENDADGGNQLSYTPITSCISITCRLNRSLWRGQARRMIGAHLVLVPNDVPGTLTKLVAQKQGRSIREVCVVGVLDMWSQPNPVPIWFQESDGSMWTQIKHTLPFHGRIKAFEIDGMGNVISANFNRWGNLVIYNNGIAIRNWTRH